MLESILQSINNLQQPKLNSFAKNIYNNLNKNEKESFNLLYTYLKTNKEITTIIATKLLNRPTSTIRRYLVKLVELGLLYAIGENKNRKYILK